MEASTLMRDQQKIQQLRDLSVLMDSKFQGPFGFKFGLDGILGLIPFVGDFTTSAVSIYIIIAAAKMGCSPAVLVRMGLNIVVENLADMFPALGNIFDFFWRANNKNIILLDQHMLNPRAATFRSRLTLVLVVLSLIGILVASIAFTVFIFKQILEWISLFSS
ncbi:MAG: DUF4112 domain-containing protein [Bdellovibrionales bacterium]|nr:DUF4112 domain-containing protein [Bdellovibrionales bacterium]